MFIAFNLIFHNLCFLPEFLDTRIQGKQFVEPTQLSIPSGEDEIISSELLCSPLWFVSPLQKVCDDHRYVLFVETQFRSSSISKQGALVDKTG